MEIHICCQSFAGASLDVDVSGASIADMAALCLALPRGKALVAKKTPSAANTAEQSVSSQDEEKLIVA